MKKNIENNEMVITALFGSLWGVVEISLGTLLHASKIPFSGTLLTAFAVVIITISRSFINYKGSIIAISSIAATLKLTTVPGFNVTPFIAIVAEGLIGEIIYSIFLYNLFSCITAGSLIMLYTLIHGLLMQGIFFGFKIYDIYIEIMDGIGKAIGYDGVISNILIPLIICIYIFLGSFAGWFGWKVSRRAKNILQEELK